MLTTRGVLLSCCTASLIFSQAAPKKQLTARELFYAAAQAPAKSDTARPPAKRPARPKPVEVARAEVKPPSTAAATAAATPPPATAPMPTGGAQPLGLR